MISEVYLRHNQLTNQGIKGVHRPIQEPTDARPLFNSSATVFPPLILFSLSLFRLSLSTLVKRRRVTGKGRQPRWKVAWHLNFISSAPSGPEYTLLLDIHFVAHIKSRVNRLAASATTRPIKTTLRNGCNNRRKSPRRANNMCFEWKNRFSCSHIGFRKVERCASLGLGCFGPDGTEKFVEVDGLCYDCRARLQDPIRMTRENDPWKKDPWKNGADSGGGDAHGSGQDVVSSPKSTDTPSAPTQHPPSWS
jgi:hypothetical protein